MIFGVSGEEVNAQNHVMIFNSETDDGYWLHTRGMAEFGRPDIGIENVPEEKIHDYENEDYNNAFYNVTVIEEE